MRTQPEGAMSKFTSPIRDQKAPAAEWRGGSFIDPGNVGSSIQWRLSVSDADLADMKEPSMPSFDGEVVLSDCIRVIRWDLDRWNDGLAKLTCAIDELKLLRRAYSEAAERYNEQHIKYMTAMAERKP